MHGSTIAPPLFQAAAVNSVVFGDKPQIPGLNSFYGGTEYAISRTIRPGDGLRVNNVNSDDERSS